MKGVVLALMGLLVAVTLTFAETPASDFALGTRSSVDPATSVLRITPQKAASPGQLISDSQTERRGSRPIVAYTVFSYDTTFAEVSVQPLFGRINGAQLQLNW